ncbi:REP-associated tyrosine transposase [Chromohalobacter japonicus]|uniref:REP-associated tyrosine transposase n=1 Tax=Chromohalobacter japonicus TaxID=223900 RepID=UPI001FF3F626|nr:transposase [Chromohalobacter japonicus]MCK0751796.1 transposase [Chromohalobacter japonicus]
MPNSHKPGYKALRAGRRSLTGNAYHITTCTHQRRYLFNDWLLARVAIGSMKALHDDQCVVSLCFVVMPDHIHWLFTLGEKQPLSHVVKRFKGRSAQSINRYLARQGVVWEEGCHDHLIRDEEDWQAVARYIVANPLRAGLVEDIGCYPHWDAIWL